MANSFVPDVSYLLTIAINAGERGEPVEVTIDRAYAFAKFLAGKPPRSARTKRKATKRGK